MTAALPVLGPVGAQVVLSQIDALESLNDVGVLARALNAAP